MSAPAPRVAIVGTGMIAAAHLRAARDAGADVVGVLGSAADRSRTVAEEWRVRSAYRSVDELIDDRPDVVHVCTPNSTHVSYALAAVRAGIHVVVEKPIATDLHSAELLVREVRAAGVVAAVPFVYRYHPLVRELRHRRAIGQLGDVHLIHGSYLQDWLVSADASTWRVDPVTGGASRAFADIGSHWCDLAEFISGERFVDVVATMSTVYPSRPAPGGASFSGRSTQPDRVQVQTEDTATVMFRSARGVVGNAVISQVSAGRKNRLWLEVDGSAGSAVFDQEAPDAVWLGAEDGATILRRGEGDVSPDQARLNRVPAGHPQGWPDAFAAFCADVYAAVRGSAPDGLPTVEDGLRSVRIVDAVLRSSREGRWDKVVDEANAFARGAQMGTVA